MDETTWGPGAYDTSNGDKNRDAPRVYRSRYVTPEADHLESLTRPYRAQADDNHDESDSYYGARRRPTSFVSKVVKMVSRFCPYNPFKRFNLRTAQNRATPLEATFDSPLCLERWPPDLEPLHRTTLRRAYRFPESEDGADKSNVSSRDERQQDSASHSGTTTGVTTTNATTNTSRRRVEVPVSAAPTLPINSSIHNGQVEANAIQPPSPILSAAGFQRGFDPLQCDPLPLVAWPAPKSPTTATIRDTLQQEGKGQRQREAAAGSTSSVPAAANVPQKSRVTSTLTNTRPDLSSVSWVPIDARFPPSTPIQKLPTRPAPLMRNDHKIRLQNAWTAWYASKGSHSLSSPSEIHSYYFTSIQDNDLFIYWHCDSKEEFNSQPQLWLWSSAESSSSSSAGPETNDGSWSPINIGDRHPQLTSHRLILLPSGKPRWVTRKSANHYFNRLRRSQPW